MVEVDRVDRDSCAAREGGEQTKKTRRGGPNRPGLKRRQLILDSAEELLRAYSFLDITYSQIAEKAGLPVSSCYHYYGDKFEVFQALDRDLSEKFSRFFNFDHKQWSDFDRWHRVVDFYTQKCDQFVDKYPLSGDLWFKGKLPAVISPTASRDFGFAERFEQMMDTYFVLPELPDRRAIFYCAYEIFEHVMASIWLGPLDKDWVFGEANKATKAYLGQYLSEDLPRRLR